MAIQLLSCLQGVVGVLNENCPCTTSGRPVDYNQASSGLYLGDLIDWRALKGAADCAPGSGVWAVGAAAINDGIIALQNNIMAGRAKRHRARAPHTAFIGEPSFNGTVNPGTVWAGVAINPRGDISHGELVIEGISTAFNATGTIEVFCYDSLTESFLWSIELDTTANILQTNPLGAPEVLPFAVDGRSCARYWLVYELDIANLPKDSECMCNCNSMRHRSEEWMEVTGTYGDDIAREARVNWNTSGLNYGLFLDVTMRCNALKSICDKPLDFTNDPNAGVLAEALWYLSAAFACRRILNSGEATLYTTWDNETTRANQKNYTLEAQARIKDLIDTDNPGPCFVCEPNVRMVDLEF